MICIDICIDRYSHIKFTLTIIIISIPLILYAQKNPRIRKIPTKYAHIDTVAIIYEMKYHDNKFYQVRLINPTSDTIRYFSFSNDTPWYKYREQVSDSSFKVEDYFFCTTNSEYSLLYPGESAYFKTLVDPKIHQIGIEYTRLRSSTKYITWSELVSAGL